MSWIRVGAQSRALVIIFGILCLLLQSEEAHHGTEYVVGDNKGWDLYPGASNWGKDKHFTAGDVLVFKYSNPLFSVAAVDAKGYQSCSAKSHLKKLYNSGDDHVVLKKGQNFFICNVIDYCGYGMRIEQKGQNYFICNVIDYCGYGMRIAVHAE